MIISKKRPASGIRFAWLPVQTNNEGRVWLEYVHFNWIEGWGWGSDGHYEYWRLIPQARYDAGERAQNKFWGGKAYDPEAVEALEFSTPYREETDVRGRKYFGWNAAYFKTPPNTSKCGKLRTDGPTPCHYPHCTCMDVGV